MGTAAWTSVVVRRFGAGLLALLLAGCGDSPDLVALGATPLPGTVGAAFLGGNPLSLSPDGRHLFWSSAFDNAAADAAGEFDLAQLRAYRLLDLARGEAVPIAPPQTVVGDYVDRYGMIHDAGCWQVDGRALVLRTGFRGWLRLDVVADPPRWVPAKDGVGGLAPGCGERGRPWGESFAIGPFHVVQGERLEVREGGPAGPVRFTVRPLWSWQSVRVADVQPSPDGRRLALVYSKATGSFTGRSEAVVVAGGGAEPRPLGATVLAVRWHPDARRLFGYGRADGERDYAIYHWTVER